MKKNTSLIVSRLLTAALLALFVGVQSVRVMAHCDGLDGPVVGSARKALDSGNVTPVLMWISKEHEPEIKQAFQNTLTVRKLNAQARELADKYFFETLVRVHRQGEGAPYTGLKPAGRNLGPAIPAADKALESGNVDALVKLLASDLEERVRHQFHAAYESKQHATDSVEAGRKFVESYVRYIHYVEGLHASIAGQSSSHSETHATEATPAHAGH